MGGNGASSKGAGGGATVPVTSKRFYTMPARDMPAETATVAGRKLAAQNGFVDYNYRGIILRRKTDGSYIAPLYYDQLKWLSRYGYPKKGGGPATVKAMESTIDKALANAEKALKKAADARKRKKAT
ncbi:MAG: hypothetical protein GXY82_00645 [Methanospirillum sp.]|nr:hypothetical protein [Methanospirillum sp.]